MYLRNQENCWQYRVRDCMNYGNFETSGKLSALQRCPYYRGKGLYEFWYLRDQDNCPQYRGRDCMNVGIFGTSRTVHITEVSIL